MILYFIFLPVAMLLFTLIFFCAMMVILQMEIHKTFGISKSDFREGSILMKLLIILVGLLIGVILQAIAIALSAIFVAVAIVPAYLI